MRDRRFHLLQLDGHRKHGPLGHGKHFLGPVLAMSPIMLPIEIISNLARLLSLTVRLWVNMFVSETLYVLFLGLMLVLFIFWGTLKFSGYIFGAIFRCSFRFHFILLHIFVAVLQAFVFTILPVIYVCGRSGRRTLIRGTDSYCFSGHCPRFSVIPAA